MNEMKKRRLFQLLTRKSIWILLLVWMVCTAIIYFFASTDMINQRLLLEGSQIIDVISNQYIQIFWSLLLIGIIYLVTRKRDIPNLKERAPQKSIAKMEVAGFLLYGIIVLLLGQEIGRIFQTEGIGLHMHGSFYGSHDTISPLELLLWSGYNFIFYFIIPYIYVRRKGYSHQSLNLTSSNRRKDIILILIILVIESIGQLSVTAHFFELSLYQMVVGGGISFVIHLFGTVLPMMFFIYCILLNRYFRMTSSALLTTIYGGLTYALFHIFEYWTVYTSFEATLVSLSFVFMQFFGPGMVKSYLTLRTGNAWVHAWAYHAIAPHVLVDTPYVVKYFKL